MDYLIKNARVIDPANNIDAVSDVLIENGKIAKVEKNIKSSAKVIDAHGLICAPGLIDIHVHLREPGYENKETICSGTRSAVKGGFTAVCMMPNTSPPMDTPAHIKTARKIIKDDAACRVLVCAALTQNRAGKKLNNFAELKKAGASALSDDGSPLAPALMKTALINAAKAGLPVLSHSEDTKLSAKGVMNEGFISNKLGLAGIPNAAEYKAVEAEIKLAKATKKPLHLCHISTKESCAAIAKAKKEGVKVTAEAAPHHFTLTEKECESFSGNAKMNPPLRAASDVEVVKQSLKNGTLDAIATDHAPHGAHEKEVEFDLALFGIIGLETAFALSYQTLVETGLIDIKKLLELMSVNPARILGVKAGSLSVGAAADVTLIDLNKEWVYSEEEILSASCNTPYIGRKLKGKVTHTFVGGELKYDGAEIEINP